MSRSVRSTDFHPHLRPGRVLPHAGVTVTMANLLIVRFLQVAAVLLINSLGFAVITVVFRAVDFQRAVTQSTCSRALALTGHVPPGK